MNFMIVSTAAVCLTFIASWIPSRLAAKIDPVALIRFN